MNEPADYIKCVKKPLYCRNERRRSEKWSRKGEKKEKAAVAKIMLQQEMDIQLITK
jgi:hypothetical protein